MAHFKGFSEGKTRQTAIPYQFFRHLLPVMDDLDELKLSLYIFWRLDRMEGAFRFLRRSDIAGDKLFMSGIGSSPSEASTRLDASLEKAIARGSIIKADAPLGNGSETVYFLNTPKGRAALRAIESGQWRPFAVVPESSLEVLEPPNIFRLYEENIGLLTPIIADSLSEAENTYPLTWIEEAIALAVKNNKRSWQYALAILERWHREGKHGKKEKRKDRSDTEEDRRRYVEGEYSEFVEH